MTIPALTRLFEQLQIEEMQRKSIMSARAIIINTITDDQLYEKGIDGRGQSLGEYANITKEIKKEKGQRYDHITLRDTGDFHSAFTMDATAYGAVIYSKDEKANQLKRLFGAKIYDLTNENQADINHEKIKPNFLKQLRSELHL
jgi:hypothetical protein